MMNPTFIAAGLDDWVFLIVVIVSIASKLFTTQNKGKKSTGTPKDKAPSPLDNFFKQISEQMAPLQTQPEIITEETNEEYFWEEEPDLPPVKTKKPTPVRIIHQPTLAEELAVARRAETVELVRFHGTSRTTGSQGLRMPGMSRATVRTHFNLKDKKALRHAVLGQLVFGAPRAYDLSFDNTPSQK